MGIGIMNDSCPENPPETTRYAVFATVYSFVLLVGLPLNVLSLWIILKRHGLRSSNTVLMANLALSDLVLTLSLPLRIYYYATATWPFGAVACIVNSMMFFVNIVSSSVIITFISVDRMLAIAFPLRSRKLRSPRSSGMVCAAMWILLIPFYLANARGSIKKKYECDGKFCFDMSKWQTNTHIGIAIMILTLLTVNIVSSLMTMRALHRRQTDSVEYNKGRIMLIFCANVIMFVVFFVPFSIVTVLRSLNFALPNVIKWIACFVTLNCCLDPFIYYFSLDAFWKREVEHTPDF